MSLLILNIASEASMRKVISDKYERKKTATTKKTY